MSGKDPSVLLAQMHHAAQRALVNVEGLTFDEFLRDETAQEATLMNLLQIGEMAMRLTRDCPDFLVTHADLPVSAMRGMRNRIAHGYFFLDLDVVWQTVNEQVPDLCARLTELLNDGKTHGQS